MSFNQRFVKVFSFSLKHQKTMFRSNLAKSAPGVLPTIYEEDTMPPPLYSESRGIDEIEGFSFGDGLSGPMDYAPQSPTYTPTYLSDDDSDDEYFPYSPYVPQSPTYTPTYAPRSPTYVPTLQTDSPYVWTSKMDARPKAKRAKRTQVRTKKTAPLSFRDPVSAGLVRTWKFCWSGPGLTAQAARGREELKNSLRRVDPSGPAVAVFKLSLIHI